MDPKKIYQSMLEAGNDLAEKQFNFRQLDDQTKSMLASITLQAKSVEGVNSMSEAKEIALSTTDYRNHLREVARAGLDRDRARVKYDAIRALFDAQRTQEATERAALRAAP